MGSLLFISDSDIQVHVSDCRCERPLIAKSRAKERFARLYAASTEGFPVPILLPSYAVRFLKQKAADPDLHTEKTA